MTTIDEKNLELECLGDMTLTMVNVFLVLLLAVCPSVYYRTTTTSSY